MKKVLLILLAMVLAISMTLVGCPEPIDDDDEEPEVKTLTIGMTLPLNFGWGVAAKETWEALIPAINEAGGLTVGGEQYKVEAIIYDDEADPTIGRAAVERLIHVDGVRHLVGISVSAVVYASLAATEPEKVVVFTQCMTDKILDPEFSYVARTGPAGTTFPVLYGFLAEEYPEATTAVQIAPDTETGRADCARGESLLEAFDIDVIENLYYPEGTSDFSPLATKVKDLNPDIASFNAMGGGSDVGLLCKALWGAGWTGVKWSTGELHPKEIKAVATAEQVEALLGQIVDIDPLPEAGAKVQAAYIGKYGTWSSAGLGWVNGWFAFRAAVEKAGSLEPDAIMAALEGLEFDGVRGKCVMVKRPDFDNHRYVDMVSEMHFGAFDEGEFVHAGTVTADEGVTSCETFFGFPGEWID